MYLTLQQWRKELIKVVILGVGGGHIGFFFFKSLTNQNKECDKRKRNKASTLLALRLKENKKGQ